MRATRAGLIAGISVGGALLVLGLVGAGVYALRQKKRAQRALELSKPFGNVPHETCHLKWFSSASEAYIHWRRQDASNCNLTQIGQQAYYLRLKITDPPIFTQLLDTIFIC